MLDSIVMIEIGNRSI